MTTVPTTGSEWKVPDIARHFRTTTAYWYKLLREGKIKARRDARGQWLVPDSEIRAFEAKRMERMQPPGPSDNQPPVVPAGSAPICPHRDAFVGQPVPEFRLMLVPLDAAASLKAILDELAELSAQVAKLRAAHSNNSGA